MMKPPASVNHRKIKLAFNSGRFEVDRLGLWHSYWRDPYHLLLTIPWPGFILLLVLGFALINGCFALLYLIGHDSIANAKPGSFGDAFFFSVQTFASIGYGFLYPQTTYADIVATIEALFSILSIALMTGLAFARFSQPTARVVFSQVAVVTTYNGVPTLMLRVGNHRYNQIIEAEVRLYLMLDELSSEGHFLRRLYDLKLVRERTSSFTLTWTIMHPIDQDSVLWGVTQPMLEKVKAQLNVSLTGIDETVSQSIHARHSYGYQEILWDTRFVDMISRDEGGHRYLDFSKFHEVISLQDPVKAETSGS